MRMAEELAKRSTCARLQVGSVITSGDLTQVLGIGYNGNACGLPNRCDSTQPGACGCIHGELNSLVKAGAQLPGKVMFVSASPCVMCAKSIINCNVAKVYFREPYRDPAGLQTLRQGGVDEDCRAAVRHKRTDDDCGIERDGNTRRCPIAEERLQH